jgi:hypothetical protein
MAVGGVLGGAFNALVTPLLFGSIVEYPLMIIAALPVAPLGDGSTTPSPRRISQCRRSRYGGADRRRCVDLLLVTGMLIIPLATVLR